MKNKIAASSVIILLVLGLLQITLNITPIVFGGESVVRKEIWKIVNVTNLMPYNTLVDINVSVTSREGVHIACSPDITRFFENPTGYVSWWDWLNGNSTVMYHWGDMDWVVSNGSLTSITYDEIQHWGEMYFDSGGGVNYTTFMGNTYMADWNLTSPYNDPDIVSQAYWQGNEIKIIDDLMVNASKTVNIVFKIVITKPGVYTFNITHTSGVEITPLSWTVGGAATLLVPYEYTKIQEAVNAAGPNFTVIVFDGIYDEQVIVNKSLTIQGMGNNTIIKPSSAAKLTQVFDGLFWYGTPNTKQIAGIIVANVPDGSNVTIKNLKVDESSVTTKPAGADYLAGIFYRETGGTIEAVNIVGTGAWSGSDRAYGIYLSAATNTVSVRISGSTISNYDKNGIEAMGNKLTFSISNNVLIGRGSTLLGDEVQNGITAGRSSVGTVNNNMISNLVYQPETWWAAGILFVDSNGSADGNNVTDCQIGVIFQDGNGSARDNIVNGGTVGLIGLWAQYTKGGAWTASFSNNTVSGVRDSSGYENGAIGAQSWSESASIAVTISNNRLIGSLTDADGIFIGDVPAGSPAGNITVAVINNTISDWEYGVRFESSVLVASSRVNFNNINGSQLYGIFNNCSDTLDASYNWWGDETGPYHSTLNPSGSGNNASDDVEFKPWLIKPYPPLVPISVVHVVPQFVTLETPSLGKQFTINVTVANVSMLYGFQFRLRWNSSLLNIIGVNVKIPTVWGTNYYLAANTTGIGNYTLGVTAQSPAPPFNGTTTVASLTFKTIYDPVYPENATCSLALENVTLADPDGNLIIHLVYSGNYLCYSVKPKILFSSKEYIAKKVPTEFDAYVNVTNIVDLYAFKFEFKFNGSLLKVLNVSVPSLGGTPTVIMGWLNDTVFVNVTGITPPANGSLVLAKVRFKVEQGLVWNTQTRLINSTLSFTIHELNATTGAIDHEAVNGTYLYKPVPGDLDMDGVVNIIDLAAAARAFGTSRGEPGWFWIADLNCDDTINILDIVLIARNYLREEPEP